MKTVTEWKFEVFCHAYRICLNSGINNFLVLILISVPFIKSYFMMPTLPVVYLPYKSLNYIYETIKPHIFLNNSLTFLCFIKSVQRAYMVYLYLRIYCAEKPLDGVCDAQQQETADCQDVNT